MFQLSPLAKTVSINSFSSCNSSLPSAGMNDTPLHTHLSGPEVHVYKQGSLFVKPSILRSRRPCTVTISGTTLTLAISPNVRTYNLQNARLQTYGPELRIVIHTANEKVLLYAFNMVDFHAWVGALSDSMDWKIQRFYVLGEVLGRGGFARVVRGVHRETGDVVAIKIIEKSDCADDDYTYLQREIDVSMSLSHRNIVQTSDLFESETNLYIVLEYMEGGTLQTFMDRNGVFNEVSAKRIMRDILGAVQYIHATSVVHRDLKVRFYL